MRSFCWLMYFFLCAAWVADLFFPFEVFSGYWFYIMKMKKNYKVTCPLNIYDLNALGKTQTCFCSCFGFVVLLICSRFPSFPLCFIRLLLLVVVFLLGAVLSFCFGFGLHGILPRMLPVVCLFLCICICVCECVCFAFYFNLLCAMVEILYCFLLSNG